MKSIKKIKKGKIYRAINILNNKSYIGKTFKDFEWYKKQHINHALNNYDKYSRPFYNAIRKYGSENFKWELLFKGECSEYKLSQLEIFWIDRYNTCFGYGYNCTIGGECCILSKENRIKATNKMLKTKKENGIFKIAGKKISNSHKKSGRFKGQNNPASKTNMSEEKRKKKGLKTYQKQLEIRRFKLGGKSKPKTLKHRIAISKAKKGKKIIIGTL